MANKFPRIPDRSDIRMMAEKTLVDSVTNRSTRFKASLTPSQISGNSQNEETVSSIICTSDDDVTIQYPSQDQGLLVSARVTDKNEVTVVFENTTGSAITPTSGTYYLRIHRGG